MQDIKEKDGSASKNLGKLTTEENVISLISSAMTGFSETGRVKRGYWKSNNFVSGSTGWILNSDGTAEINDKFTSSIQTLTGAGAVNVTQLITSVVTTGANALTLADGSAGQLKIITMTTFVGNGTLTPTNLLGATTITFTAAGQGVLLAFVASKWHIIANYGTTIA